MLVFALSLNIFGLISVITATPRISTKNYSTVVDNFKYFNGESAYIVDSLYFRNENNKNFYFEIPGHNIRFQTDSYFPHLLSLDRIKIESLKDTFYVGNIYSSAKYFKPIIENNRTYEEVFKNEEDLKILIIQNSAPEIENAEEIFNVNYLGEIENFTFFKKMK
jgi:hypothetical protein